MHGAAPTVLIVDDDPAFRKLLRHVVEEAGFVVVDEAGDGRAGVRRASELRPSLITMDLDMPGLNGAEATEAICRGDECPPVVIISGSTARGLLAAALRAGARWHVEKRDVVDLLPEVLDALAA